MRLGQLSRKIAVRSNDIVDFLAKQGVNLEDSFNARVDDEHVQVVISHFAPHLLSESLPTDPGVFVNDSIQELNPPEQPQSNEPDSQPEGSISDSASENETENFNKEAEQEAGTVALDVINEVNGVIKPPKVELQGLKVLGKIELPEPKKKEPESSSDQEGIAPAPAERAESRRQKNASRPRRAHDRPRKNPVAMERERRAREQEEERKQQDELEKQRKAQYYQKRVKPKGPTKAIRIHNEEVAPAEDIQPQPKSLWGRFVKWLTS